MFIRVALADESNSRFEDTKKRYWQSAGRLHRQHNQYVLTLTEANSYQMLNRQDLLPSLLDFEQEYLESLITSWYEYTRFR